jgi:hypothetical protein
MSALDPAMKSPVLRGFSERFVSSRRGELTARFHLVEPIATFESDIEFGIVWRAPPAARVKPARRGDRRRPYMIESFA